jgi:hypothetical protein
MSDKIRKYRDDWDKVKEIFENEILTKSVLIISFFSFLNGREQSFYVEKLTLVCHFSKLIRFPSVFHQWFLNNFPDPTSWLKSRQAYGRTCAVMSMVGFVLG